MNSLQSYIEQNGMDPAEVMNALQTMAPLGTCSDNAVTPADVVTLAFNAASGRYEPVGAFPDAAY
jgi:hypothetical protein